MTVKELIKNRRTIRKFSGKEISEELLISYVDCARLAPSGANMQPLKFAVIHERQNVRRILPNVKWAAYLNGLYNPDENEVPAAFIAVFKDRNIVSPTVEFDAGAAVMSINLAAEEDEIGCCIMGAINRPKICSILNTEENLELLYMVALGYKKEHPLSVVLKDDSVKYFLKDHCLTVPKRSLEDVLIKID